MQLGLTWVFMALCLTTVYSEYSDLTMCDHGVPLREMDRDLWFCGRGPTRRDCPSQYSCKIHPTDLYAVCCPDENVDPCNNFLCPAGKECTAAEVQCITMPCPPVAECRLVCEHGAAVRDMNRDLMFCGLGPTARTCPTQYSCKSHPLDLYAYCCPDETVDPCKTYTCPSGEECIAVEVNCIMAPCPPVAECRAEETGQVKDPCVNHKCAYNEDCSAVEVQCESAPCPPIAQCKPRPRNPCEAPNVCDRDKLCVTERSSCDKEPCPWEARCVPRGCQYGVALLNTNRRTIQCGMGPPELSRSCPSQYHCAVHPVDEYAFCCPDENADPCKTHSCSSGEVCVAVEVQCITAPCPPVAECRAGCQHGAALLNINRVQIFCGSGQTSRSCPSQYQCIADPLDDFAFCCPDGNIDPCKTHSCSNGEECVAVEVYCVAAPCPPLAECRAASGKTGLTKNDPCKLIDCGNDETCITETSTCETEPCPVEGRCVPTDENVDPCKNHKCALDEDCSAVDVQCESAPCPPIAQCIPRQRNPCELIQCTDKMVCITERSSCGTEPCPWKAWCVHRFRVCQHGAPLLDINHVEIFCGLGPTSRSCPSQYQCDIDAFGAYAYCCPDENVDPCKKHRCSSFEVCIAVEVECITPPCPPVAQCGPVWWNPCSLIDCANQKRCISERSSCDTEPCLWEYNCVHRGCQHGDVLFDINHEEIFCGSGPTRRTCPSQYQCSVDPLDAYAVCCPDKDVDPCKTHSCPSGEECIAVEVQCIATPCPPVAQCRPWKTGTVPRTKSNPCKRIDCGNGETCITETSPCETEPCPVEGRCVPIDGSGSRSNIYSSVSNLLIFVLISLLILTQ